LAVKKAIEIHLDAHPEAALERLVRHRRMTPDQLITALLEREERSVTGKLRGEALSRYYDDPMPSGTRRASSSVCPP
jgi:hypothetical protein